MFETLFGSKISAAYISLSLFDGMLLGFIIAIIFVATLRKKKNAANNFYFTVLIVYIGAVIALTLRIILPKGYNITEQSTAMAMNAINYTPFVSSYNIIKNSISIDNYYYIKKLLLGNFVMLMPLGILVPLMSKKATLLKMIVFSLSAAIFVEGLQLVFNILAGELIREVEIDDVILNSLGCILSYAVFSGIRKIVRKAKK